MKHRKNITDLNDRRVLFKTLRWRACIVYIVTSLVFFLLVKEGVVGSYSLYQFHESSVGKEFLSSFLLRDEEEGRRREGRRRGEGGGEKRREGGEKRREGGEKRREKRRRKEENRKDERREERREKIVVRLPMCVNCSSCCGM